MADKSYTTIAGEASAEYEEKRSVFIGHACPVRSEEEAADFIARIRMGHKDARHNVFGYTLSGGVLARYSDDGEPQGTAGVPVLDVIRKSGVDDACVVVTRYFGGILLGAGGLVRAYSTAAKAALEAAKIVTLEPYTEFSIECSYADHGKFTTELSRFGAVINDTRFAAVVTLFFSVPTRLSEDVLARIRDLSGGKILPVVRGEHLG